jgi:hypothetical protein
VKPNIDDLVRKEIFEPFLIAREARIKEEVVWYTLSQRIRVEMRKPAWMPTFVWKWMWRQVMVYEDPMVLTAEDAK